MGEIAVLHPQDIMKNQFNSRHRNNLIHTPMRSRKSPKSSLTPNSSYNPRTDVFSAKAGRRKRSPANSRISSKSPPKNESKKLIIGEIKILKRGEALTDVTTMLQNSLTIKQEKKSDLVVPTSTGSNRVGILDCYAGSPFYTSPPPSSLPVPGFCKKKTLDGGDNNFSADLRRILNLDLD